MGQYRDAYIISEEEAVLLVDPDNPGIYVNLLRPIRPFGGVRGLLGTHEVGAGQGLLLRSKQVHTIGMNYPIDVVHLSRKGKVIRVRTMKPGRIGPFILGSRWVLEMDAGEAQRLGIRVGGRLERRP